jgi:hypothetical protein
MTMTAVRMWIFSRAPTMPNDDILERARASLEGVTPGPWYTNEDTSSAEYYVFTHKKRAWDDTVNSQGYDGAISSLPDAKFIAWTRTGVPALIAELTKAREERDANKKLVAELNEMDCDVIVERDHYEEVIGSLAATAGCTLEWSSGHEHGEFIAEALALQQDAIAVRDREIEKLKAIVNAPDPSDFLKATETEMRYQRVRWGAEGDAGKTDADWFWLIGYLAGKALHNPGNNHEKRLHRITTIAAAAGNWHAAELGATNMRPGSDLAESEGQ